MLNEFIDVFIWYVIPRNLDENEECEIAKGDVRGRQRIQNSISKFCQIIGCEHVDIVKRKIGNRLYNVVYDDEWLLKYDAVPSIINSADKYLTIYGPAIVAGKEDSWGNLTSLTDDDINNIRSQLTLVALGTAFCAKLQITQVIKAS